MTRIISEAELAEFVSRGVVVIKNVFSDEEINCLRSNFHFSLRDMTGYEVEDNTVVNAQKLSAISSTGGRYWCQS